MAGADTAFQHVFQGVSLDLNLQGHIDLVEHARQVSAHGDCDELAMTEMSRHILVDFIADAPRPLNDKTCEVANKFFFFV